MSYRWLVVDQRKEREKEMGLFQRRGKKSSVIGGRGYLPR
ncbi:hypothetical protein Tco_0557518, partial [Tanacetum coccineum]